MQIVETLTRPGSAVQAVAQQYGLSPAEARAATVAGVEVITRMLERNTLSRGGLADLVRAIGDGHHADYLAATPATLASSAAADGGQILAHIFGSNEKAEGAAYRAAAMSGVSASILKQLLPIIAAVVMGSLAKQAQGGLGDILSKIPGLGGGTPRGRSTQGDEGSGGDGGLGDILRRVPGIPGGEASPAPRRAAPPQSSGAGRGGDSPLPIPGDEIPGVNAPQAPASNPYGDLSDVIRRGGAQMPGGGSLGNIVREVLGGALGFQSKGIMGWILRLIVMRWGWGLLRTVLGRVLMPGR